MLTVDFFKHSPLLPTFGHGHVSNPFTQSIYFFKTEIRKAGKRKHHEICYLTLERE
jgi:hypothetical protein